MGPVCMGAALVEDDALTMFPDLDVILRQIQGQVMDTQS